MDQEEEPDYSERCIEKTSMTDNNSERDVNESTNMLYDILVYREWPKTAIESHGTIISNNRLSFAGPCGVTAKEGGTSSTYEWIRSFWPFSSSSPPVKGLPHNVQSLFDQRIAWKFR